MSVIRINKNKDYTVMSNYHFKEKNMSLKAKGLLSEMLSLPDNWDYSIAGLVTINKENESAIKSTLDELKEFGYLIITKKMPNETKSGRIEYIYDIFEEPKKQEYKKQEVENLGFEFQEVDFQEVENQRQYNINNKITKNKKNNNKERNIIKNNKKEFENEFEEIWKLYPKKQGKINALKSYIKVRAKGIEKEIIINGLNNYINYIQIEKIGSQYIKNGSTWFYQECWNDDYTIKKKITTKDLEIDISDF